MTRTVSAPMQAATAATATRPGYLIEIAFSGISRLSSIGDVTWNGYEWSGSRFVDAAGVTADGGRIVIGNTDDAFTALVLNEGVADRRIKVWSADGAALAAGDPVLIFDGVGDEAEVDLTRVSITLAAQSYRTLQSPRRFIGQIAGFNHLIPAGTALTVAGTRVVLERG